MTASDRQLHSRNRGQQSGSSPARRALVGTAAILTLFAATELLCRLCFAAVIGRSVLFYGTGFARAAIGQEEHSPLLRTLRARRMSGIGNRNNNVRDTGLKLPGYAKYHPHQKRSTYDIDTGEVYPVTINSRGFRGKEIADEKPPGVVRVVTLGASSTFGYHNRDELTYPAQLESVLNASCPTRRFEVINLGIPHLTSAQILALFAAEGRPLQPDVVTFYEGFNDANELDEDAGNDDAAGPRSRSRLKRLERWLRERLLLVALGDTLVESWTRRYSAEQIAAHIERSRHTLLANLDVLAAMAVADGFLPIVTSQQARSLLVPREEIRGVTLQSELELVALELDERGWLGRKPAATLAHGALLGAVADWAQEREIPFVDTRAALDRRRDTLVSWVHLNHEGNRIVAEQLAAAVLAHSCPDAGGELATAPAAALLVEASAAEGGEAAP